MAITPEEQYVICEKRFNIIDNKLDRIYDKLFEDNGSPCMQTRVDRNTRWVSGVSWALGVMYITAIGTIAWLFKK